MSHGATVSYMTDYVKPVLKGNPYHIVFHISNNDVPSNKTPNTKTKSILELALSSKSTTCETSILIKKENTQEETKNPRDK